MKKKEFISRKNKIWKNAALEFRIKKIPDFVRNIIENKLGDPDCEADQEDYLECLEGQIKDDLQIFVEGMKSSQKNNYTHENNIDNNGFTYRKSFERRLHLVTFVSDKYLNFNNWINESLIPTKHIKWKIINVEWNKKYPFDAMTIPVMKAEYFRARKEEIIRIEYFKRKQAELKEILKPYLAEFNKRMEYFRNVIHKYFPQVNTIEELMPELEKLPAFQGVDVEDLTLKEIVEILESKQGGKENEK